MRKSLLSSSLLLLSPLTAFALGLGDIKVQSSLNEPLDARIELQSASFRDLESLVVKMASTKEFLKADVEKSDILRSIRFRVKEDEEGQSYIHLTTRRILREPFLDLLIDVSWGAGRLLREYTILLDPPEIARLKPKRVLQTKAEVRPPVVKKQPKFQAKKSPASVVPAEIGSNTEFEGNGTAGDASAERSLISETTSDTDTLWSVAYKMRPNTSISMEQMMIAIQRENPRAFNRNNINGLMGGFVLRISDLNKLTEISKQEAIDEVRRQNQSWKQIRQNSGYPITKVDTPQTDEPKVQKAPVQSMTDVAQQETAQEAADTEAQLELLTSEEVAQKAKDAAVSSEDDALTEKLAAQLALTEELMESQVQENEELKARIRELERLLNKQESLVELKDENLAIMQQKQRQQIEETPAIVVDAEEMEESAIADASIETSEPIITSDASSNEMANLEPELVDSEDIQVETNQNAETSPDMTTAEGELAEGSEQKALVEGGTKVVQSSEMPTAEEDSAQERISEQAVTPEPGMLETTDSADTQIPPSEENSSETTQEADSPASKPQTAPKPTTAVTPAKTKPVEPDLITTLLNYKMEAGAAGGVLLLLLALLALRKKKSKTEENFQESILNVQAEQEASIQQPEPIEQVDESTGLEDETTFLSDFSSSELDSLQPDDTESDPISEADVFIVYGRYRQAEELLKSSIDAEPTRLDYHMKLLEVFHGDKQKTAFIEEAGVIKELIENNGSDIDTHEDWLKVQELAGMLDVNLNTLTDDSASSSAFDEPENSDDDDDDDFDLDSIDVDELERQLMASEAMLNDDFNLDDDALSVDKIEPTGTEELANSSLLADADDLSLTDDLSLEDDFSMVNSPADEMELVDGQESDDTLSAEGSSSAEGSQSGSSGLDDDSFELDLNELAGELDAGEEIPVDSGISIKEATAESEDEFSEASLDIDLDDLDLDGNEDSIADLALDEAVADLSLDDEVGSVASEVVEDSSEALATDPGLELDLNDFDLDLDDSSSVMDENHDSTDPSQETPEDSLETADVSLAEEDFELDLDELGGDEPVSVSEKNNQTIDPEVTSQEPEDLSKNTSTDEMEMDLGDTAVAESAPELEVNFDDLGDNSELEADLELNFDDLASTNNEESTEIGQDEVISKQTTSDLELDLEEFEETLTSETNSEFEPQLDVSIAPDDVLSEQELDLGGLDEGAEDLSTQAELETATIEPEPNLEAELDENDGLSDLELDLDELAMDDNETALKPDNSLADEVQLNSNTQSADDFDLEDVDLDDINLDDLGASESSEALTNGDAFSLEQELEQVAQAEDKIEDIDLDSLSLQLSDDNLDSELENLAAEEATTQADNVNMNSLDTDLNEFAQLNEEGEDLDLADIEAELGRIMEEDNNLNETSENSEHPSNEEINEIDDIGNKLDLAKAYIEKGDKDAAIELLSAVMEIGDNSQKLQAKKLLELAK